MNTNRARLWPALLCAALCAACAGSDFQWDKARQLRPGMSEEQVSALMGAPSSKREQPWGATWTWAYVQPRDGSARAVSVGIGEGRVVYGPGVPASFTGP